jgi:hypothetical protein
MAKARLLQAVCAVALLAAAPAFAQQSTTQPAAQPNMAPADNTGSGNGSSDSAGSQSTHRAAMRGHPTNARTDTSQNAAVDQLNEQSFQAAQRGQAFSASDTGSSGGTMSGGTANAPPSSAASGAGGGTGSK